MSKLPETSNTESHLTSEFAAADTVCAQAQTASASGDFAGVAGESEFMREGQLATPLPHVEVSESQCRVLLAGIDTLDFGLFVDFEPGFGRIVGKLATLKRKARKENGLLIGDGRCLMLGGGKPNYPFHLQYPGFQLYLSRKARPEGDTPNVFVSLNSELLWHQGVAAAVELVKRELAELAPGKVLSLRPNRCDFCVDVLIPGGVSVELLDSQLVTRCRKRRMFTDQGKLQTYYVGATGAEISLRVYSKSAEIEHSGKLWFLPLWGLEENADVWRFEFQVTRAALRERQVNSLEDLISQAGGWWSYLTSDWVFLKSTDSSENAEQLKLHPLWKLLQECHTRFDGDAALNQRRPRSPNSDGKRNVQQMASSVVGFAARRGLLSLDDALAEMAVAVTEEFEERNFLEELQKKRIRLGTEGSKAAA